MINMARNNLHEYSNLFQPLRGIAFFGCRELKQETSQIYECKEGYFK